jgi:drug/metabolite transporter (DMT)-like permease
MPCHVLHTPPANPNVWPSPPRVALVSQADTPPSLWPRAEYRRGALLVAGAALAWSTAGLLVRWTVTDPWTTLFWRSIFAGLALLVRLVLTERRKSVSAFTGLGLIGTALGACFAISMISFINALSLTTVANVMVFQAASPLFAALLAWAWLKERISARTGIAIAATMIGVTVMVSSRPSGGDGHTRELAGDLISLAMSLATAFVIILAKRERRVSMAAATCLGLAMTALVSLPFADLAPSGRDLALLALFGIGQMALGLAMFSGGVRLIPAADAGLISVIECVLAPLWVWLAFGEAPNGRGLFGGAIVLMAVVYASRKTKRRPKRH